VLVAWDRSMAAATALPLAEAVAAQLGCRMDLLNVTADAAGVPHDEGLARALLEAASDQDVTLLVLTTHGRAIEEGRGLGRVARAVASSTTRPVLIVRPELATRAGYRPEGLRHLLLPLDGTPTTAAALAPTTELAAQLGATIDLLHVVDPAARDDAEPGSLGAPVYLDQPHHEWPAWAAEMLDRLVRSLGRLPERIPVRVYLAAGAVDAEIMRFAEDHEADAIVLVRRSALGGDRARTLQAVLEQAPCAVLLVGSAAAADEAETEPAQRAAA
jgi:nucleotide-binding universal stress UspA family protein